MSGTDKDNRRGLANEIFMWKASGAAALWVTIWKRLRPWRKKQFPMPAALAWVFPPTLYPLWAGRNYLIEAGTMEIGVGHHGMSSLDTCKLKTADEAVDIILDTLLEDNPICEGEEVAVLISGMGNTILMELHILFNHAYDC